MSENQETEKTSFDLLVEALQARPEYQRYKPNQIKKSLEQYPDFQSTQASNALDPDDSIIPQLATGLLEGLSRAWETIGRLLHPYSAAGKQYWLSKYLLEIVTDNRFEEAHSSAIEILARTNHDSVIHEICQAWANTRHDGLEELIVEKEWVGGRTPKAQILTALLTEQPLLPTPQRLGEIRELVKLAEATGKDRGFIQRAKQRLLTLETGALPLVERVWHETFAPILLEVLQKNNFRPDTNEEAGCWLALMLPYCENEILEGDAITARFLTSALNSPDQKLREQAAALLPKMKGGLAQAELCWLAVQSEQPFIEHIAVRKGWQPIDLHQRALFFFVSGQWDKYEVLDFDGRILRLAYQAADATFRQRLANKIKAAGKTDYLAAIIGGESKRRAEELNAQEAQTLVKLLTAQANWQGLWELVPLMPLKWSVEAVRQLVKIDWQPGAETENILKELATLVQSDILLDEKSVETHLPLFLAQSRSHLKLSEESATQTRLYGLAFAPHLPLVAIAATGSKIILWNIQKACIEQVLRCPDEREIQALAFSANGTLCFGTGNNTVTNGAIYRWVDDSSQPEKIGEHAGGVVAIEPGGEHFVISAGRDGGIILWDVAEGRTIAQVGLGFGNWPRQICVSADGELLAVFHDNINLYRLPDLTLLSENNLGGFGIVEQGCFTPDNLGLLLSKHAAQLHSIKIQSGYKLDALPLGHKEFAAQKSTYLLGPKAIPSAGYALNATEKGLLEIMDWGAFRKIGEYKLDLLKTPDSYEKYLLTNYRLSANGAFLGTLDSGLNLNVLDVRPLTVRRLFTISLASVGLSHMEAIAALRGGLGAEIAPGLENALRYIETVVRQWRWRYFIELDELPLLQPGEFDIELEIED